MQRQLGAGGAAVVRHGPGQRLLMQQVEPVADAVDRLDPHHRPGRAAAQLAPQPVDMLLQRALADVGAAAPDPRGQAGRADHPPGVGEQHPGQCELARGQADLLVVAPHRRRGRIERVRADLQPHAPQLLRPADAGPQPGQQRLDRVRVVGVVGRAMRHRVDHADSVVSTDDQDRHDAAQAQLQHGEPVDQTGVGILQQHRLRLPALDRLQQRRRRRHRPELDAMRRQVAHQGRLPGLVDEQSNELH